MNRSSRIALVAALLVAAVAGIAHATQVAYFTPKELGARSELVVRGTVQSVESFWNEKRTKIFTKTSIAVDETYKGQGRATVEILQLGGVAGGVRMTVQGAVLWRRGEEVLLFLEPYVQGSFQVSGLSQGKFLVERDPGTGAAFVSRPALTDVKLFATSAGPATTQQAIERVPIERFVNESLGE